MSNLIKRKICGARKKRGRGICNATALYPNGRCRVHGGATPSGPASPHFRHGRHSVVTKEFSAFNAHYQRALADPDLLALDSEIAMIDARIGDLMERTSKAKGDQKTLDGMWPQLENLFEQRRKLVDTESKRLKDLHAMVSVDRVMALVAYVSDAVKRHVTDPKILSAIFMDLRKVLKPAEGVE